MFPFYTPWNPRKPKVFWCFQEVWNGNIGLKRVNAFIKSLYNQKNICIKWYVEKTIGKATDESANIYLEIRMRIW